MINKTLRWLCWRVTDVVDCVRTGFDMWLKDYEYGSMASGVLRFYLEKERVREMMGENQKYLL